MDPVRKLTPPSHKDEPSNVGGPKYQVIDGHKHIPDLPPELILSALQYKVRDDDVTIVTYPKNGTTWTQQIMILLFNDGEVPEDVKQTSIYTRSPFLEMMGGESGEKATRPCAMKTHLPFKLQPWNPKAKYIVIIRNPKDACVSFYHHTQLFNCYQFKKRSFDDFFEYFLTGDLESGCYFDWYLSWWEHRDKPNVEFFLYEDMKENPKKEILRMAQFVGQEWADRITANEDMILNKIVANSDFKFMKDTVNKSLAATFKVDEPETFNFVRKGTVGDWRDHLSDEQNCRLEAKFRQKFGGTGLDGLWAAHDIF